MSEALLLARAEQLLSELGLRRAAEVVVNHADAAASLQVTYLEFLVGVFEAEHEARYERYLNTRMKLANFPFRKTLADFDFAFQPSLDEHQVRELATLAFVEEGTNVIFLGPPGVGKSHLAVALEVEAVRQRISTYFVTLHRLVEDLRRPQADRRLERRLQIYTKPRLLILDELGACGRGNPYSPAAVYLTGTKTKRHVGLPSGEGQGEVSARERQSVVGHPGGGRGAGGDGGILAGER